MKPDMTPDNPHPPESPATILWLGAHKTGTTFLQKSLLVNARVLTRRGVGYEPLVSFRDKYVRPLLDGRNMPLAPASDLVTGQKKTLIFDENIIGLVQHALSPTGLYPQAVARCDRLLTHLGLNPDTIILGVRSFDTYLPSLYCETLKSTPYQPFEAFTRSMPKQLSWFALLARLHAAYPNALIRVYAYENLSGGETALLARAVRTRKDGLKRSKGGTRMGFSAKAVAAFGQLSQEQKVDVTDLRRLTQEFPKSRQYPGFDPWTEAEKDALKSRYAQDLAEMRQADWIEHLSPALRPAAQ